MSLDKGFSPELLKQLTEKHFNESSKKCYRCIIRLQTEIKCSY